jgi:GTP-binding protein
MTQTKFVLSKALKRGLNPMVIINKVDRPSARVGDVESEVFELFDELGANDEQLDFPILYASGKNRWSTTEAGVIGTDLTSMYDLIVNHVPKPLVVEDRAFSMLVTQIFSEPFIGRCLRGRITSGTIKLGDTIHCLDPQSQVEEKFRVTKLISQVGLEQVYIEEAFAGAIVAIAGARKASVNSTLCDVSIMESIPHIAIDPPTVAMTFMPNDSPTVGKEGNAATAQSIRDWLVKEAETNVSLTIKMPGETGGDDDMGNQVAAVVYGRGELQLGILIENMRREGFELCASAPQVVFKTIDGQVCEPVEEVVIECHADHQGAIIDKLCERKGEMVDLIVTGKKCKIVFKVATRGLIGYRTEFMNDTKGEGVLNHAFDSYVPHRGTIERSIDKKGAMISMAAGQTSAYAIEALQSRGNFFIGAQTQVYAGMVIGEHNKSHDIEVNPVKCKAATNIRAASKDEKTILVPQEHPPSQANSRRRPAQEAQCQEDAECQCQGELGLPAGSPVSCIPLFNHVSERPRILP